MNTQMFIQLAIIKDNKVLLQKRKNTGYCDGMYALPGGHLELGESIIDGVCREVKEELDFNIDKNKIDLYHIVDRLNSDKSQHYTDFIFKNIYNDLDTTNIKNNETDKCEEIKWFDLDKLPDNMILYQKIALITNLKYSSYIME